jgi:hypothetical protein
LHFRGDAAGCDPPIACYRGRRRPQTPRISRYRAVGGHLQGKVVFPDDGAPHGERGGSRRHERRREPREGVSTCGRFLRRLLPCLRARRGCLAKSRAAPQRNFVQEQSSN